MKRGMKYGTGTNTASLTIPEGHGQVVCESLWYTSPGAGTLVIYRVKQKATANAAVAADTALVIDTDSAGKVGGAVLTTSDYVLVFDSGGTGGWQLSAVSAVAAVSSSTVSLTLGTAITCAAGDSVFVCRAADIVTMVTATETQKDIRNAFNGFRAMPVHAVLAATGTCQFSAAYAYMDE